MFEQVISFIKGLFGDSKIKINSNCCNKVQCKCCSKTNVDLPTPKITKIINLITCSSRNNIDKVDLPWEKNISI